MGDTDATFVVDGDVPSFMKDVDEMVSSAQSRFQKLGSFVKEVLGLGTNLGAGFQQTPVARTTKELKDQWKIAKDILDVEKQRRDVNRAQRFEENRQRYGDDAELDWWGNPRKQRAQQQRLEYMQKGFKLGGSLVDSVHSLGNSGFSNAGFTQAGTSLLTSLMHLDPYTAAATPLVGALGSLATDAFQKQDLFREQALRRYQIGGQGGVDVDEGKASNSPIGMSSLRKRYGFGISDFSSMYTRAGRSGAFDSGDERAQMIDMMRGELGWSVGGNMASMFGAIGKAGGSRDQQNSGVAAAFGLQIAEGMSRGRMGELFDQLASAMDDNAEAIAKIDATADRFLFISQLGPQFRGNTAAARDMDQSIKGLGKGNTPYTLMTSLGAAGFGKGASFSEALLSTQKGLDTEGGVSSEALITQNFSNYVSAYAKANKKGKAEIVHTLSLLTGLSMPKVEKILDRLAKGPLGKLDLTKTSKTLEDVDRIPPGLIGPRRAKARGEDMFRPGINSKDQSFLDSVDTGNAEALQDIFENSKLGPLSERDKSVTAAQNQEQLGQFLSPNGAFGVKRPDTDSHPGQDLLFPPGTTVLSPCNGSVVNAGPLDKTTVNGWFVLIRDAKADRLWRLVHLDPKTVSVKAGSKVKKGDVIGKTLSFKQWNNGVKTHLHVGMEEGGKAVDPMMSDELQNVVDPKVLQLGKSQNQPSPFTNIGGAGSGAGSVSSFSAPGGVVQMSPVVKIEINDKTRSGVEVKKEVQENANRARMPAPGDTPAQRR